MVYAVIDTNVIVASLLTKHHDSATARVMDAVFSGKVIPLLNDEIIAEYRDVLHRKRLGLNPEKCDFIISLMADLGMALDRISTNVTMIDEKDRVFYEIALAGLDMGNSKLVTGNTKQFPKKPFVVTPAEMLQIINEMKSAKTGLLSEPTAKYGSK
jgi:putative PIN family toxin of toxin-antitoxin system